MIWCTPLQKRFGFFKEIGIPTWYAPIVCQQDQRSSENANFTTDKTKGEDRCQYNNTAATHTCHISTDKNNDRNYNKLPCFAK